MEQGREMGESWSRWEPNSLCQVGAASMCSRERIGLFLLYLRYGPNSSAQIVLVLCCLTIFFVAKDLLQFTSKLVIDT
jgi:hypothetical protein